MINFQISCPNPSSQLLEITLIFNVLGDGPCYLQLPAWRAGRYQLANFAQNVRGFRAKDAKGHLISFEKVSKDRWIIQPSASGPVAITYEYWAGKMDAGSAWVDDQQVYVNLVNCCFEVTGRQEEEIEVALELPDFPKQVSTLVPISASKWKAKNFQMLADSTILAAKNLAHQEYHVASTSFHLWIHGEVHFDQRLFVQRLKAFSEKLISDFGEFPESEYHFIFQLLPYPHYHGVEHQRGTVITFGPAESLLQSDQMEELLGVSCHELYHAWNVCRIRPKELLPYDFSKETYTRCGLILEGVTTYMGDLYLLKSGVYDLPTYLRHLEKVIQRESAGFGWRNYTIQESSFDLWLDGYVPGIADRKVNIYTRGALLALCLDLLLIKVGSSLTQVMHKMWINFGKPFIGYELSDFKNIIIDNFSSRTEIENFFNDFVDGYQDLFPTLQSLLAEIGISLVESDGDDWLLHQFGIRTMDDGVISQLHPLSKAYFSLMKNDRILSKTVESCSSTRSLQLQVERNGRALDTSISEEDGQFFPHYQLLQSETTPMRRNWMA